MRKVTTEEFIKKAIEIHGDKYDYSKVKYENAKTKICIICPIHGEFWQTPDLHLQGHGCNLCNGKIQISKDEFVKRANLIHNNKYDYSKTNYINYHTKVCIVCPIHGEFWQEPANHLSGRGCRLCSRNSYNYSTDEWVQLAKEINGNKYDYSKVNYTKSDKKVCIICPEHGEFWQKPANHLNGQGCPHCNESKLEKYVADTLRDNNVAFERQKKFEWLGRQSIDFYLPKYKIAIECQGIQHFKPTDFGGKGDEFAKKEFLNRIKRDEIKRNKIIENKIKLVYITDKDKVNILKKLEI